MSIKIGDAIAKYKEIEAFIEGEKEKFDEAMKPWIGALQVIENSIRKELLDQNLNSFKSEYGTAYLSRVLSVTVDDPQKFLEFVKQGNWDFLVARPRKEPVQKWMDDHSEEIEGELRLMTPTSEIGLATVWNVNINIRKPT